MTQHLLRDRLDDFGKSLFDAADVDAPKAGSTDALLVALGVGAAITATTTTAAAATTTTTTVAASTTTAAALTVKGVAVGITKVVLVAAIATGGAIAVHHAVESRSNTPSQSSKAATTLASSSSSPTALPKQVAPETKTDVVNVNDLTEAPAPTTTAARKQPTPSSPASVLGEQVELVDEARARLRQGDPAAALEATRQFEQRFGAKSALSPEAMLVAVQAHLARGDEASARVVEGTLRQHHPSSPATHRATELLASTAGVPAKK